MNDEWEEKFHSQDRKLYRKMRKEASSKDRSKFKKTNQDQFKNHQSSFFESKDPSLLKGRVLAIKPEGIVVDADNQLYLCILKGSLKQETTRLKNLIAIGDFVSFLPKENEEGTIVHIEKRRSILSRADNLSRNKEQLIAVNVDQVIITTSLLLPPLKPFLVDRYIIAARKGNLMPIIVINKVDLLTSPPEMIDALILEKERQLYREFFKNYQNLGIPILPISVTTKEGIKDLKAMMQSKTSVFSGQSGVGKSSLINAITGADLRIGKIVNKTSKGAHTTSTAHLLPLEGGGFCIDTPGIKSFGLWEITKNEIQAYFTEILQVGQRCKYLNCSHLQEPECGVKIAVESGEISSLRFASYCALMNGVSQEHRHR